MRSYMLAMLLLCIFTLSSCTNTISKYFNSTHHLEAFETHIANEKIPIYLKVPGDIEFETDKKEIIRHIKKEELTLTGILAYGETELPPHYSMYLLMNPEKKITASSRLEFVSDTLIQGDRYVVFCQNQNNQNIFSFRIDCKKIFQSISTRRKTSDGIGFIFDLSKRAGNRYLEGLHQILNYPTESTNEEHIQLQMALNFASFMAPNNTYDSLLANFPTGPVRPNIEQQIQELAINGTEEVHKKILNEARNKNLIMFNENHFYPNHRKALTDLLPKLKELGFNYLALEALSENQDKLLNNGHPPTTRTGFYTSDPYYARLLRSAQNLGFTFVGYENQDSSKDREQAQAHNLVSSTFHRDDSARVVVLAGLDHILEEPTGKGKKRMGHILIDQYGLDPLTISQSHLNNYYHLADPLALIPGEVFESQRLNSVDFLLLNNILLEEEKPNFYFKNSYSEKIQACIFLASETTGPYKFYDKIPYKSALVETDEKSGFHLPKATYIIVVYDRKGNVLQEQKIEPEDLNS